MILIFGCGSGTSSDKIDFKNYINSLINDKKEFCITNVKTHDDVVDKITQIQPCEIICCDPHIHQILMIEMVYVYFKYVLYL